MDSDKKKLASITIDASEIKHQLSELEGLLKSTTKSLPDHFISLLLSKISTVANDIIFCDAPSAGSTGLNIVHRVRLGAEFERLTAAIRAGEFDLESF